MTANHNERVRLKLEAIPEHIREDVGRALLLGFRESIRDPEAKKRFDELGKAFLARMAQKGGKA